MVFYFVQRGETLYTIAKRYQTTVHALVVANHLDDPNAISPGLALVIPRPGEVPSPPPGGILHLVRPGETVLRLAEQFGVDVREILRANQIAHPEFVQPGQQLVIPEGMGPGEEWPMWGHSPGRAGASPVVLEGIPSEGWRYVPQQASVARPSAPTIRYNRVFAGLADGCFYAFDLKDGRIKWRLPAGEAYARVDGDPSELATPAIFDGLAYLCGLDGAIHAVDAYSGKGVWRLSTDAKIMSSPAVLEDILYVGNGNGVLSAIEVKTGTIVWRRCLDAAMEHPVAVGDRRVFAVTQAGTLWSLDAQTGAILWQVAEGVNVAPVFAEVVLLAGGSALDPQNGKPLWRVNTVQAVPSVRGDRVIYPHAVVDLFTGQPLVTRDTGDLGMTGEGLAERRNSRSLCAVSPICSGDLVVGVDGEQNLFGWDAKRGNAAWEVKLPAASCQPPAVAPGQVVVALDHGLQTYWFDSKEKEKESE